MTPDAPGAATFRPTFASAPTTTIGEEFEVLRLGFGTNRLTGPGLFGYPEDEAGAQATVRRAVELGVNFFDTSQAYGRGTAEEMLAAGLAQVPNEAVILTKGGATRFGPDRWGRCGRPEYLRECIENSLRRLRRDVIDVYMLHSVDPKVPLEESLGALRDARDEGKIRHVGVSNVNIDQLRRAQSVVPIAAVEVQYNLTQRSGWAGDSEEMLRLCEREGIAFIAWGPLGSGSIARAEGFPELAAIAEGHGATTSQVALAWLMQSSPATIAIPGTSKAAHLESNLEALNVVLSDDELATLDAAGRALEVPSQSPLAKAKAA